MSKNVVIYPGHFDPFTLGHLNIVQRACRVFGRVVVAVAEESPKKAMFSTEERFSMVQEIFQTNESVEVELLQGLLVDYFKEREGGILLRGIRTVSDFEYEYQMALANKTLDPRVETVFMMTDGAYSYLSSSVIKEIARLGGDVRQMVPANVLKQVEKKYGIK